MAVNTALADVVSYEVPMQVVGLCEDPDGQSGSPESVIHLRSLSFDVGVAPIRRTGAAALAKRHSTAGASADIERRTEALSKVVDPALQLIRLDDLIGDRRKMQDDRSGIPVAQPAPRPTYSICGRLAVGFIVTVAPISGASATTLTEGHGTGSGSNIEIQTQPVANFTVPFLELFTLDDSIGGGWKPQNYRLFLELNHLSLRGITVFEFGNFLRTIHKYLPSDATMLLEKSSTLV
jgi:hypothetical protein